MSNTCDCEKENDGKCRCEASEFCIADSTGVLSEVRKKICNGETKYSIGEIENSNIKKGEVKMSDGKIVYGDVNPENVYMFAKNLINERQLDGNRMGLKDDLTNTNLISKNYSPMIIRKYNFIGGWITFIGIICDEDLSDIDKVVNSVVRACKEKGMFENNIQSIRNFTGILSESIVTYYNNKKENCMEGLAIFQGIDKGGISSLYGDFMQHGMCRNEWYSLLNIFPHI